MSNLRITLMIFVIVSVTLLSIFVHELSHVIIDWDHNPERICFKPTKESFAYTQFEEGFTLDERRNQEFWPTTIQVIFIGLMMIYIYLNKEIFRRD